MRGVAVTELKATMSSSEFETQWQAFLISGFSDWIPAAWNAAGSYVKADARSILRSMIADWVHPIKPQMTDEQLAMQGERLAKATGARIVEPDE